MHNTTIFFFYPFNFFETFLFVAVATKHFMVMSLTLSVRVR